MISVVYLKLDPEGVWVGTPRKGFGYDYYEKGMGFLDIISYFLRGVVYGYKHESCLGFKDVCKKVSAGLRGCVGFRGDSSNSEKAQLSPKQRQLWCFLAFFYSNWD